jgi:membrane-bound lytic murein transglycosylase B
MTPFAAVAVKAVGAAAAAAMLTLGVAQAAPPPTPTPSTSTKAPAADHRADRRAIARAVFESEADVLGITPKTLRQDLLKGQKVSDLAKDKGMTKEQFETRLIASVKPRLAALVDHKVITQAQADKVIDRISKGYIPFWDGLHRAAPATAAPSTATK